MKKKSKWQIRLEERATEKKAEYEASLLDCLGSPGPRNYKVGGIIAKFPAQEYDEEGIPIWKMPRQAPREKYNVIIDKDTQLYLLYEITN